MKNPYKLLLVFASVMISAAAMAHHSTAAYDLDRDMLIEGTVEEYHWTNPHCWIKVLVMDATGATKIWNIESGSPSVSVRSGWSATTLKPGDHATIVFKPRKDGTSSGALAALLLPDGRQLPGMVAPSGPLPAAASRTSK